MVLRKGNERKGLFEGEGVAMNMKTKCCGTWCVSRRCEPQPSNESVLGFLPLTCLIIQKL